MFPCWDEPAFRATQALTVTIPAKWSTLSEMPIIKRAEHGSLAATTVARSPKMPAYPVDSAGDLASLGGQSGRTKPGVWAVRNVDTLLAPMRAFAPVMIAQYIPQADGYALPLDDLQVGSGRAFRPSLLPDARGIEGARFSVDEKAAIVPPADTYVASQGMPFGSHRK